MREEGSGCLILILIAVGIYWWSSDSKNEDTRKAREEAYEEGYEAGRKNPAYSEEVAEEYVKLDPVKYCSPYFNVYAPK